MPSPRKARSIAILALPGVQLLDVSGPLDVFAEANVQARSSGEPGKSTAFTNASANSQRQATLAYRLQVIASRPGPIRSSSGIRLLADTTIGERGGSEKFDTLLVAGCPDAAEVSPDARVLEWLRKAAPHLRRYGSVCSGAFVLAAAGLLDGRRVTTHWAVAERLAQAFPQVSVDPDAIHVRDGRVRTAAGVTAGLDLALALVEEDLGREIALRVAAQLVMFFKRPGGQLQFSRRGEAAPVGRSGLQEVQRWVAAHPGLAHDIPSLAARIGLSARHFSRLFTQEVGVTPATWVEEARVSAARTLLESGDVAPKQVASRCGFANADTLRRTFTRHVGVTPAEYRKRYAPTAPD